MRPTRQAPFICWALQAPTASLPENSMDAHLYHMPRVYRKAARSMGAIPAPAAPLQARRFDCCAAAYSFCASSRKEKRYERKTPASLHVCPTEPQVLRNLLCSAPAPGSAGGCTRSATWPQAAAHWATHLPCTQLHASRTAALAPGSGPLLMLDASHVDAAPNCPTHLSRCSTSFRRRCPATSHALEAGQQCGSRRTTAPHARCNATAFPTACCTGLPIAS